MAELTYAELTQGQESTILPHTHKFTLKNVVTCISALHKIDEQIHIQAKIQLSKEEYARKRIHNGCLVQIESPVTQDNCSASLRKSQDADRIFNPQLTAINFKIKKMCNVRTFVTYEYEIFFVILMLHTKM